MVKDSVFKQILTRASLTVRIYPCRCRELFEAVEREKEVWLRKLDSSQIPPRYREASLKYTGKSRYESELIPVCTAYIEGMRDIRQGNVPAVKETKEANGKGLKPGLGLMGSIGTGKTYYMCALLLELLRDGRKVLFTNLPEWYNQLKCNFGDDGTPEYARLVAQAKEIEVLGLDEVGQRKLSPWASEELYGVINYRYNWDYPTLFTSSKSVEELKASISKDTVDRLFEMCAGYQISGTSLRQ